MQRGAAVRNGSPHEWGFVFPARPAWQHLCDTHFLPYATHDVHRCVPGTMPLSGLHAVCAMVGVHGACR